MFRKRELSIQVRKADRNQPVAIAPVKDDQRAKTYARLVQKVVITGAVAVYGYVLLDTFRQVAVAQNTYSQES